jgi:hypothetical protein
LRHDAIETAVPPVPSPAESRTHSAGEGTGGTAMIEPITSLCVVAMIIKVDVNGLMEPMAKLPAKSRLRKLVIALVVTALAAGAFHIVEYRRAGQSLMHLQIGSITRRTFVPFPPNYTKLEDGLWMGGYVEQPPKGTQAVLNLCGSKDPYQVESNRVDTIPDGPPAPSVEWLGRQVAFIESERAAGHAVYVHCAGGVSRSSMVMAAYYMHREGWTAEQAIHFLQSKRPAVNPNPAFRPLLAEWERTVKATTLPSTSQP